MKILYGVQATGQGHISRARAMAQAFSELSIEVDWLFTGRDRERLFDMEPFGEYLHRRGLTFSTVDGHVRYLRTVVDNNFFQFLKDIQRLPLEHYDLIVTDFEPVSAWAGRLRGLKTIGIGHQYAFGENTPRAGDHWLARTIMHNFAPVDIAIGLHWARFESDTLPPILDLDKFNTGDDPSEQDAPFYLVYLPFEDQQRVTNWLCGFREHNFIQYAPGLEREQRRNVLRHPTSISSFKRDLHSCRGVICNSGFELNSECLQLGKPVLTKPLAGQTEQLSNALALETLGYARAMPGLCFDTARQWLDHTPAPTNLHFPDVAASLASWLAGGCIESPQQLSRTLWRQSTLSQTGTRPAREHSLLPSMP